MKHHTSPTDPKLDDVKTVPKVQSPIVELSLASPSYYRYMDNSISLEKVQKHENFEK